MASKGYISAQIFTARQVVPVPEASVTIIQRNGDNNKLVGFRVTDRDGRIQPVEVETPDEALSQEPGNGLPFASFDIHVEHPGYYPVSIVDAQVFGGVTTEQRVELIPIADNMNPANENVERVYVTPQNL